MDQSYEYGNGNDNFKYKAEKSPWYLRPVELINDFIMTIVN